MRITRENFFSPVSNPLKSVVRARVHDGHSNRMATPTTGLINAETGQVAQCPVTRLIRSLGATGDVKMASDQLSVGESIHGVCF